ncbi:MULTISPECIES: TIM44-like domain-containing protein [unclassified Bradyrhizobium]|uniref:Tim44 domain-containing protein n=1 Tax=unclassified Bradyrhizobium TaxID=2631580 RepID=UPI002011C3EE|nr:MULTISPECIES: TIM44-like domain-containing protein [unclassified Bradyrhizobium]
MTFSQRMRASIKVLAIVLSVAMPVALAVTAADARVGGGGSSGSRGSRTFSAPPTTSTAPNAARPFERSMTQPSSPGMSGPAAAANAGRGGFFNRPGLLGGLAAGFLGAGLFGMLFGGGLFGGLGGLSSIIGLVLQVGLIVIVVRLLMSWWQRRNSPAAAYASGPSPSQFDAQPQPQPDQIKGFGFGFGANAPPLKITPDDYEAFERLLGDIQAAWSRQDVQGLHRLATPEMVSYFAKDLAENEQRGVVNEVSNVKLLQGDLAEAWREGETDYASVAMRFSLVDKTTDKATGRIVDNSDRQIEVTEVWTFLRDRGGNWILSAIQQV